ncbi:metallophosphoesterase [Deinococcus sp.]|uniref:metallophosphoesterase n=1 Tax=Deinococcus sp. TaxID=47478 RepID=UPI0025FAD53D|nr:metallophosphoesterase [Deinococcus sp.]
MPLTRRQFLTRLVGSGAALGLLGGGVGAAQAYVPAQVNTRQTTLPGLLRPLRAALLADLHYGPFIRLPQVRGWVDQTLRTRPDLILLLGDFLDVDLGRGTPTAFLDELGRLKAPLGVWGVWGNHDYGSFGRRESGDHPGWEAQRTRLAGELSQRGISMLLNEGRPVRGDLYLGGVDDAWWGTPDAGLAFRAAPVGTGRLLMSHNPDYLMRLAPDYGLMLSGHTHGGQIRLPVIGAPIVPSAYGQRFAQGWIQGDGPDPNSTEARGGAKGLVSRGLGVTGLPLRNLCPSEIIVLELAPG